MLGRLRRLVEALSLLKVVASRKVAVLGNDHEDVMAAQHDIAVVLQRQHKPTDAHALLKVVAHKAAAEHGKDHWMTRVVHHAMTRLL